MSKNLFVLPALLLAASVAFVSSCKKDCSFKQSDYLASYVATEDCSASQPSSYVVIVTGGATETDLRITNVWGNFANAVNASFDCETVTIPRQEPDNDKFFVEGTGTIAKNDGVVTLTLTYTVTDESVSPIASDVCTGTVLLQQ